MSKLASKLSKRIMATVLSVAMVMSNMTVYASELTGPQADNTVDEVAVGAEDTSVTPDDATTSDGNTDTDAVVGDTTGDSGDVTTDNGTGDDAQTPDTGEEEPSDSDKVDEVGTEDGSLENDEEVKEEELVAEELSKMEDEVPNYDYVATNKVDVWDFGGADLGTTVNNMLTPTDTASITSQLGASGSTGAEIEVTTDSTTTPETKDIFKIINADSAGIAITPLTSVTVDANDPYAASGNYAAALTIPAKTSTAEGAENGYITLSAKKGDTFTIVAYAEGTAPAVTLTKANAGTGSEQTEESLGDISTLANETTHIIRLFAKDSDFPTDTDSVTYKISSTSNLAIARIYRGNEVTLSGSVTGLDKAGANAKLTFTPSVTDSEAKVVEVTPSTDNGSSTYTATLKNGVEYTVSVGDCDVTVGSGTDADDTVTAIKDDTKNITIEKEDDDTPDPNASKLDLWDFGGGVIATEQEKTKPDGSTEIVAVVSNPKKYLDPSKYNNMLTEDIINSLYDSSIVPGTDGKTIKSFAIDKEGNPVEGAITESSSGDQITNTEGVDFCFSDGGKHTNHRLRSVNTALTRYDGSSRYLKTGEDDGEGNNIAAGYIYSNAGGTKDVYVGIRLEAGDIMEAMVCSNGTAYVIEVTDPDGDVVEHTAFTPANSADASVFKTYANKAGMYKIYCANSEKLVVGRIIVEHTNEVTVSGTVTLPEGASDLSLVFTSNESGEITEAPITVDGGSASYSVKLHDNHSYKVAVSDYSYIIQDNNESTLKLTQNAEDTTHNVRIDKVDTCTLTGKIEGLDNDAIKALDLSFVIPAGKVYIPKITIDTAAKTYTASIEKGVEYQIKSVDKTGERIINDYQIQVTDENPATIKPVTENGTRNIVYEKKPVWAVTLVPSGVTLAQLEAMGAKITFTNLGRRTGCKDDEGYEYTFDIKAKPVADEVIKLRDGVYSIEVTNINGYALSAASNLTVNGSAVRKSISFVKASLATVWDFSDPAFKNAAADDIKDGWKGLVFKGVSKDNKGYAVIKGDGNTIQIPVDSSKDLQVVVTYCYNANSKFEDEETAKISTADGSTTKFHTAVYKLAANSSLINKGYVTLTHVTADVAKDDGSTKNITQTYLNKIQVKYTSEYQENITVGSESGCDYETINEALDAIRDMDRDAEDGSTKPVTVSIQPGDYEEMLVIDVDNVKFVNASKTPSIALKDSGVHIDENAVRITSYYGHGYNYFSMGDDCKWNEDVLRTNLQNGYVSKENPGSGTTDGSYWNATVVISGSDFSAEGIIFENSFNQYISKKASEDEIVKTGAAKEGDIPRADLPEGSTAVQDKAYVERAAALAIANNTKNVYFENCKIIGRQDTLDGGTGVTAAFYKCSIYGATDYIMGPMTAVFAKCDLVLNTSENGNDVAYITSAQTAADTRGLLMYNCHITSTVPGVDTASEYTSKPGLLGRPWAKSGEAVFYKTLIDSTDAHWYYIDAQGPSLILPIGWNSTLGGEAERSAEYGTYEYAKDVNNDAKRATWASGGKRVLTEEKLADGTDITVAAFLGDWDAFAGKDMTIVMPTEESKLDPPKPEAGVTEYRFDATTFTPEGDKEELDTTKKYGTVVESTGEGYFSIEKQDVTQKGSDGKDAVSNGSANLRLNNGKTTRLELAKWGAGAVVFTVSGTADVELEACSTGGSNDSIIGLVDANGKAIEDTTGKSIISVHGTSGTVIKYKKLPMGTYKVISPYDSTKLGTHNRNAGVIRITVSEKEFDGYILEAATLPAFNNNGKPEAEKVTEQKAGKNDYFTISYDPAGKSRIDSTSAWDHTDNALTNNGATNGQAKAGRINFQGKMNPTSKVNSIKFTTTTAVAVQVYWRTGSGKALCIVDEDGKEVAAAKAKTSDGKDVESTDVRCITTLELDDPGTYYLGNKDNNNNGIHKVVITERSVTPSAVPRVDWENVAAPVIGEIAPDKDDPSIINVPVTADMGYNGGDSIKVDMLTLEGEGDEQKQVVKESKTSNEKTPVNIIRFKTVADTASVKVYWTEGSADNDQISIMDSTGKIVAVTSKELELNAAAISTLELKSAGEFYLGSKSGSNHIYKVVVTDGGKDYVLDAADLKAVASTGREDSETVGTNNYFKLCYGAGSKVESSSMAFDDEYAGTQCITFAGAAGFEKEYIFQFTPSGTGKYTFKPTLTRSGKDDKVGETKDLDFTLPLTEPGITHIAQLGKVENSDPESGCIEIEWREVKEATSYRILVNDKVIKEQPVSDPRKITIDSGLKIGDKYTFSIIAVRTVVGDDGAEKVDESPKATARRVITAEKDRDWAFASYGSSAANANNSFSLGEDENGDETVRVWSLKGSGKIVPASTDGIAYYYTSVTTDKNFKFSAKVHVNEWTYSNGQDGFGLLVSDRVGENGNGGDFWTNSYMAVATKMEYHWDRENGKVDPASEDAVSLRLGLGSIERYGVTAENVGLFENGDTVGQATKDYFHSNSDPLDTSIHKGTFNTIGNCAGGLGAITTIANPLTDIILTIEKNNTGYFISYTDASGKVTTNKYYLPEALNQIDKDNIYIGFFAARNADVTFSDISLTTTNVADDPDAEERPVSYITPDFSITSGSSANSSEYEMIFSANWEGSVTIKDSMGKQIVPGTYTEIGEDGKETKVEVDGIVKDILDKDGKCTQTYNSVKVKVPIDPGVNTYKVTFVPTTPDDYEVDKAGNKVFAYNPDPNPNYPEDSLNRGFIELSNYAPQTFTHNVTYKVYGQEGQALYAAPRGSALGTGTKNNPLDVYTAVKYAQPGQTIYLMEGKYDLTKTLRIDRGINGTADKRIYMMPDPEAKSRPVFDFGGKCEGIVLAGDYWYLKDFDVTRSISGKDGIRVAGSNNVLERMETYMNGNTGIQISRMYGSDLWDDWPANNLILNCTSYLNTDSGYEDADGFACKLTSGDGNVFDGCIAHHNADDGWDLFAKVETGSIGTVIIRNCIAYKNGYVLTTDGNRFSPLDKNGLETDAGNGNGFKMGGSSLPGGKDGSTGHILQNSLAFYNKAKGIDSNSCPNIKVYNSISYNNEGANVAFYTNALQPTAYVADGLISYRTEFMTVEDNLKYATGAKLENTDPKQTQSWSDVYNAKSYYWDKDKSQSRIRKSVAAGTFDDSQKAVKKTWFESLDFDKYLKVSKVSERKSDGSIDMHGFLVLTGLAPFENSSIGDSVPEDGTTGSDLPDVPTDVPATGGDIVKGDAPDESEAKVPAEDAKDGEIPLGMWVADIDEDSLVYTGKALRPEVRVYYHETRLVQGKDYTVTYKNNVNAFIQDSDEYPATVGKKSLVPTVTVKGKGSYKGIVVVPFSIKPVPLSLDDAETVAEKVAASQISPDVIAVASGKNVKLSVTYNRKKLSDKKDYTSSTSGNIITVTAKAGGNYTGTKEIEIVTYDSRAKNLASKFKVDKIPDQQRNWAYSGNDKIGDPQPIELTTTGSNASLKVYAADDKYKEHPLVEGEDYELSYRNNYEVGTAVVVIKGIAPKYLGTKEVKFKIVAQAMNSMMSQQKLRVVDTAKLPTISNYNFSTTYAYEGSKVELDNLGVVVNNGNGWEELDKDLDYTITYKNNDKAGKAIVTITGIGNYKGSIKNTFTITPFDLSSKDPDVILSIGGSFERELRNGAWRYTESIDTTYVKGGSRPDNIVLKIKDGNGIWNKMVLGKDYTISYKNNASVNASKTPTIVIKGKGGLKGTLERPFTIVRKDFNDPEAPVTLTVEDVGISGAKGKYVPKFTLTDANGKKLSAGADYDKNNITYILVDENGNPETRDDGSIWQLTKSETVSISGDEVKYVQITVRAAENNPKCNYTGELTEIYRISSRKALIKSAKVIVNYGEEQVLKNGEPVMQNGKPKMRKKTYFNFDPENSIILTDPDTQLTIKLGSGRTAKTLVYEEDFEFVRGADGRPVYVKNTALGTASVTIQGIGKYTGTKVITFRIGSRDWNLDALEAANASN